MKFSFNSNRPRPTSTSGKIFATIGGLVPAVIGIIFFKTAYSSMKIGESETPTMGYLFLLISLVFILIGVWQAISVWRTPKIAVSRTKSSKENLVAGKIGLVLFFCVFAAIGSTICYFAGIKPAMKLQQSKDWAQTPCKIVHSQVKSHSDSDGTTYSVDIHFNYKFNGKKYKSKSYNFGSGSSSGYDGKANVVRQYPKGSRKTCFVNPSDPSEAVITREGGVGMIIGGAVGAIFALAGFGGILGTLFVKGKRHRTYSRSAKRSRESAYNRDSNFQENVKLKMRGSRFGKLIFITFFATFWNGISWTIAYNVFQEGNSGAKIFISLFLLIGLVTIGAVIYQLLALTNAKVEITVSSNMIRVGETMVLTWQIPTKAERISKLEIFFTGSEEATYRRGTNTHTDRKEFYRQQLLATRDYMEMVSGDAVLEIPANFMHSFSSSNNKIVWELKVKGDIKNWPDINDAYELEILPANYQS